jgi:hypothetical protein
MAFYKYFWDLANSTDYTDHTVGAFDNNTESGGGDFKWVLNANNTLVNNIPGVRIKPTSTTNGYWVRVSEGPVSVSWFGPQNTVSAPYTFVQLGVSQNTLNNRYGAGVVNTTDTYDTAAIKAAMNYMSIVDGENCLMFEPKQYWVTQSIQLPADNPSLTSLPTIGGQGKFIIDGNGCTVTTYGPAVPFDVFVRVPANQTVADSTYIKYGFVFKNFGATSWGASYIGSGNSFLYLAASNDVVVDNLNLVNYDIGVRLEYCPNTSVTNVNTSNVSAYSVYIKEGTWLGATLTNACSNNVYVRNLHVKDTNGQTAGLAMAGCNNAVISQFHLDGVGTPSYGIHWDSLNNGQAVTVRILDSYFTNGTSTAAIYVKAQDGGLVNIDGMYNEAVQTVVSTEMYSGTADVYFSNSAAWPAGSKLSNVGTAKWDFKAVNFGPGITTPADIVDPLNNLWVTAGPPTIPSVNDVINQPAGSSVQLSLQQVLDYNHDLLNGILFMGTGAGDNNTGTFVIGLSSNAAKDNTGNGVIALGPGAANQNNGLQVIAFGQSSANQNLGNQVISLGLGSAVQNTGNNVIGIGLDASNQNIGNNVTGIGNNAADGNAGNNVIAIGSNACAGNSVLAPNVIGLGTAAGAGNAIAQSVILSNSELPSYANHAAAIAVINALSGATTGTYLYHNQATDSIGAVRIP